MISFLKADDADLLRKDADKNGFFLFFHADFKKILADYK